MNMQEDKSIIEVSHVSKYFGEKTALDDVTLNVKKGEFVTILGPSGCGKTTLLRLIAGFQTASEGEIRISGMEITQTPPHKRPVNTVFQKYALFPHLNVYDNITFPLELDGTQIDKDFIQELLETLNISDKQEMLPAMLSGGEQQRVAIIRALATKPAIILADEPTGNLDTSTSHDVIGLLKMLSRQYQQTLIVITHDNDIAQMADRIVQIEDGKISTKGSDFHVSE